MVRYSKKPGNKRAIRKQHSKKGKRSGKSPRRTRLVKPVKKRRKTKLRGGDEEEKKIVKRKKKKFEIHELKNQVSRPDVVEEHDTTAPDPQLLVRSRKV